MIDWSIFSRVLLCFEIRSVRLWHAFGNILLRQFIRHVLLRSGGVRLGLVNWTLVEELVLRIAGLYRNNFLKLELILVYSDGREKKIGKIAFMYFHYTISIAKETIWLLVVHKIN